MAILPSIGINHPSYGSNALKYFLDNIEHRICIDSLIPPPTSLVEKRSKMNENILETNKF